MNGMAWVILHEELDNPRFYNKYAIFKTNDARMPPLTTTGVP